MNATKKTPRRWPVGSCARLRTDDALLKAMVTAGHDATSLAAMVTAYGYSVSRQMVTKLLHPDAKWGTRRCTPALAVYLAQAVRMPVEFIFDMPQPVKLSAPRRTMSTARNKGAHTAQKRSDKK